MTAQVEHLWKLADNIIKPVDEPRRTLAEKEIMLAQGSGGAIAVQPHGAPIEDGHRFGHGSSVPALSGP
jgi:hypothetical protein